MLGTDEGYQRNLEAFVGNFTAKIAASKLGKTERTTCNDDSIRNHLEPLKRGWIAGNIFTVLEVSLALEKWTSSCIKSLQPRA
jgi:hypothetical protein